MELHKSQIEVQPFYCENAQGCTHIPWLGQDDQFAVGTWILNQNKISKQVEMSKKSDPTGSTTDGLIIYLQNNQQKKMNLHINWLGPLL